MIVLTSKFSSNFNVIVPEIEYDENGDAISHPPILISLGIKMIF